MRTRRSPYELLNRKKVIPKLLTYKLKKELGIITEKFSNEIYETIKKYIFNSSNKLSKSISLYKIDELKPNILNALQQRGINSLEKLINQTEESLKTLKGIGPKNVNQIKQALARYGLSLRGRYK